MCESGMMAAKVTILFMMASFLLMEVSSFGWVDVEYEDSGLGGNGEGEDAITKAEEALVITNVLWTGDEGVSLKVCWNTSLGELIQNVTDIFLNDTLPGDLDETGKCATFCDFATKLPSISTTYKVNVQFSDETSMNGSAAFAMTVETTLLDCGESVFTKVEWTDESTKLLNPNCTEQPVTLELVCYHIGDLSNQEFCFTVPNDNDTFGGNITVCLNGPTDRTANITSDGNFSVNYLLYGEANGVDASLSLTFNGTVHAVVVETDDGRPSVHGCSENTCSLPEQFMPSKNNYRVCGELNTTQTATKTFHDMKVTIFEAAAHSQTMLPPTYLQFVFVNALPKKLYCASLWPNIPTDGDEPLNNTIIDCTLVDIDDGCFGFLAIDSLIEEAYLGVANAGDGTNQVIVPYNTDIASTTEEPTIT